LNPSLLRVNGGVVQLLELSFDEPPVPQLSDLGELWGEWIGNADERVRDFLASLCEQLRSGEIDRPEYLISALDGGLQHYGRSGKRLYHLYTCTDTGPVREHNEDACYPEAERAITSDPESEVLAIVCDGIGGQEGGEIASCLAIETLQEELTRRSADLTPENSQTIEEILAQAIGVTNDVISQRNDSEQRKERQRMGTTLVMNLAKNHEMYVAHVGDSRVYRITPHSCHQVTVDDDLASREVKLGYLLYRDAVQYPNAGALVQALGMSGAATLHPNVQSWILDEDCVFLLCSDGLSDHDRVEQYWDTEIVPLLTGEKTVSEVGRRLLELANQKNGHDNATIALVHCQLQPADTPVSPLASATVIPRSLPEPCDDDEDTLEIDSGENTRPEIPTVLPTVPVVEAPSPVPQGRAFTPTLIAGAIVVAVVGVLGAIVFPYFQASPPSETPIPSQPSESPPSP
jgi:protein phosphatase